MSSGHRAQNSLHLKIAYPAPVWRDYLKPTSLGESKGSVPCEEQRDVAIQTHISKPTPVGMGDQTKSLRTADFRHEACGRSAQDGVVDDDRGDDDPRSQAMRTRIRPAQG